MENRTQNGTALSSHVLLGCPFCGKQPKHTPRIQGPEDHGPGAYWPETVSCSDCRITFRKGENGVSDPVAKWQARATMIHRGEGSDVKLSDVRGILADDLPND